MVDPGLPGFPSHPQAAKAGKLSFSIVTGGTGGVWYPLGGAIGGVIGKNVPNTDATAEVTTAAIDNLKLLCAGKAGMAFAYDYHSVWANEGKLDALGKKQPPHRPWILRAAPPCRDQGGNRHQVRPGPQRETGLHRGAEQRHRGTGRLRLEGPRDRLEQRLQREKLGAGESVGALKDGKIDALFWSGAVPTSSIIDLATTPGLKMVILPVGGERSRRS